MAHSRLALLAGLAASIFSLSPVIAADAPPKPNILFIIADDLGYGDVGVLYQNSRGDKPHFATPHLDELAAEGMLMRQHYTAAPVCAPARASLLTGQDQGHCPVRDNQFDKAIPDSLNLASMLKQGGYHTAIIGKYGLAGPPKDNFPAHPLHRGFDEFFGFLKHRDGHTYYHDAQHPLFDGLNDVTSQYENIYSTDLFTARAKKFLTEQAAQHDHPFFLYLAYTAIHGELEIPGNAYPAGAGMNGGMQWPLSPTPETKNTWLHPDYADKPWKLPMKKSATMARRLDDGVGDILQLLRDLHLDQNTLIVFTSDNGPANEGGADPRSFDSWGPFDGFKRDVWEGGVREPTIACWPGHIKPNQIDDTPSAFWDWMPTFADVASLPVPAHSDGISILSTLTGQGKLDHRDYLYIEYFHNGASETSKDVFARKHVTGRGQQQIVRIGDTVGVRTQIKSADDPIRIYNVKTDPHEDHDLSEEPAYANVVKRMKNIMITARIKDESAPRPYDDAPMPPIEYFGPPHYSQLYPGEFPWTPQTSTLPKPKVKPDKQSSAAVVTWNVLNLPAEGKYTFTATTATGIQVWVHDAHIVDRETPGQSQFTVTLAAGAQPVKTIYRHVKNKQPSTLKYKGPDGTEKQISIE